MATNIGSTNNIKCICCLNNSLKLYEPRNKRWVINKISEKLERLCGEDIIQTVENVIGIGLCQRCMKKFCYSWETLSMVQNNIARIAVNSSQDNQPFIAASEQIQNVNHIRCLPPINLPEPDYTLVLDHAYNRKSDNLGDVKNRIGSIGDISQVPLLSGSGRKEHSPNSKCDKRKVTHYYDDSDITSSDSEMSDNISEAESNYPEEEASIQKQHADNSIENRSQNGEIKSRKSSDLNHYIDDNQSEEEESTERQGIWDDDSSDNKVPTCKQQSLSCTPDHNYNASPINEELMPRSSHDKEVQLPSTLTHLKRKASSQTVPVENNITMSLQSGKCANQPGVSSKKMKMTDSNKIEPNFHINSTPATKVPGPSSKSTTSSGTKPQKINLRFDVKRTKKASNQQSGSKPIISGSASLASIRISLSSKAVGIAELHAGSDTKATNFILFQNGKAVLQEEKNSEGSDPATCASSERVHLDGPDDFCSVQVVAPNTGVLTGCKVRLAGVKPVKIPKGVPNFSPESLQQNGTHLVGQQLDKHVSVQQIKPNPTEPAASDKDTVGKSVEHVEQNVEQLFKQSSCAQMINPYTLIPIAGLQEKIDQVADCEPNLQEKVNRMTGCEPSLQEKVDRMTGCEPSLQENIDRITSCSPPRNEDCEEQVSADAMSGTQKEVAAVKKVEQLTREDCELQVEQSANIPFKIENCYHLKISEHCVQENANIMTYSEQQEKDKGGFFDGIKLQRENNNDLFVCSQQCDQNEKELLSKMHPRQKNEDLICSEQYEQFAHRPFASNEQQVQDENFAVNIPQLEQNIRPNEGGTFVCLEQLKQTTGSFFASIPHTVPDNPDIDVSSEQSSVNGSMQQLRHKDTFIVFPREPFNQSVQFIQNNSYNVSEDPFGQSEQFTQNDSCNVSGDPLQQNERFIQNSSCDVIEDPFGQSEQFMQNDSCNVSGDPLGQNEQFVQNDSCNNSENPFAQSAQLMQNDSCVDGEQSNARIVISGEEFWQNDACIVVSGEPFGHNNNDYFTCKDQFWQNENAASEGKESSSHLSNSMLTNLPHSSVVVQGIEPFAQIFDSVAGSEQSVYEAVQVEPIMLNNSGFDFTTYPINM